MIDLRSAARLLGGTIIARDQISFPAPGHSRHDRSATLRLSPYAPDGFMVFGHAGDDWQHLKDFVRERLGLPDHESADREMIAPVAVADIPDDADRIRSALRIWKEASDPRETLVEAYLRSRGLELPPEAAGEAIRFHGSCPFGDMRRPCMVALARDIHTDAPTGIHRTMLTSDGQKVDRKMLGPCRGSAIKLDADDCVEQGLVIGEGVETSLAARQIGFRPVWALGSAGAIGRFPVLPGLDGLTILAEQDATSAKAVGQAGQCWTEAGRDVLVVEPRYGKDVNDAIRGAC